MQFKNVYISSIKHLEAFNNIINKASLWRKINCNYKIPPKFPHIGPVYWTPFSFLRKFHLNEVPVVLFSNGELTITNIHLKYTNRPYIFPKPRFFFRPRLKMKNLVKRYNFIINLNEIKHLNLYNHPPASRLIIQFFNPIWIRIQTKHERRGGDLLMHVGSKSLTKINQKTRSLYNILDKRINIK